MGPCPGEWPSVDGLTNDLGAIEPGQLRGSDGAPQRVSVLQNFLGVSRGNNRHARNSPQDS